MADIGCQLCPATNFEHVRAPLVDGFVVVRGIAVRVPKGRAPVADPAEQHVHQGICPSLLQFPGIAGFRKRRDGGEHLVDRNSVHRGHHGVHET
jgi:hypothetical protein